MPCALLCGLWSELCNRPGYSHSPRLRVGPGQNGQILFISVEQLSLNVAGDSAKTLSVLGNMGGVVDDCGLRFEQMRRRPPQNTPDFGSSTDFFEKLSKKGPYRNHTKSMNQQAKLFSRMSHTSTYSAPSKSRLKNASGGQERPRSHRAIAYFFSYIGEKRNRQSPARF